jgi:hypothetical protein
VQAFRSKTMQFPSWLDFEQVLAMKHTVLWEGMYWSVGSEQVPEYRQGCLVELGGYSSRLGTPEVVEVFGMAAERWVQVTEHKTQGPGMPHSLALVSFDKWNSSESLVPAEFAVMDRFDSFAHMQAQSEGLPLNSRGDTAGIARSGFALSENKQTVGLPMPVHSHLELAWMEEPMRPAVGSGQLEELGPLCMVTPDSQVAVETLVQVVDCITFDY